MSHKMLISLLVIFLVIPFFVVTKARSAEQSRSFYDKNGHFSGSSIRHGNSSSFYDRNGRFSGSAIRNSDGTTSFYDARGRFTGSSTNTTQPNQSNAYRPSGPGWCAGCWMHARAEAFPRPASPKHIVCKA